jgi:hypothetical protein
MEKGMRLGLSLGDILLRKLLGLKLLGEKVQCAH